LRSLSAISDPGLPIRLLLLSRNDPAEWETEPSTGHARRFLSRQPIQIGPLPTAEAQELLLDAHAGQSAYLGREPSPPSASEIAAWIHADRDLRALPLFLIAAAVSTLLDHQALSALSSVAVLEALVYRFIKKYPCLQEPGKPSSGGPQAFH